MPDIALESAGSKVSAATCFDPDAPAQCIIDGDDQTYWSLTGLYPQEVVIKLGTTALVSSVKLISSNVAQFEVEGCDQMGPTAWEPLCTIDVAESDGRLQVESENISQSGKSANYIKLRITKAWDDFCSVHQLVVEGRSSD